MHGAAERLAGGSDVTPGREIVPFSIQTHPAPARASCQPSSEFQNEGTDIIRHDGVKYVNIVTSTEETKSHFPERFKVCESIKYPHTEFMDAFKLKRPFCSEAFE